MANTAVQDWARPIRIHAQQLVRICKKLEAKNLPQEQEAEILVQIVSVLHVLEARKPFSVQEEN